MLYLFSSSVHLCNNTPIHVEIKPAATNSSTPVAFAACSSGDKPEEKNIFKCKENILLPRHYFLISFLMPCYS